MVTSNPLQLNNSPQVFPVPGGISGSAQLLIQFDTAPSAGTVTIERRAPGVQSWTPLAKGTAKSITSGALALRVDGVVGSLRVTFTGLTGGLNPILWVDTNPTPQGLFTGVAAVTSQSYIEANVKYGLQFYLQYSLPQLPANTAHKILFTTGAKPVLIKARELYALGQFVSLQVYKQPVAPAPLGTLLTVQNFNDAAPVASTVTIRGGVTTTSDGTPWGDAQRLFGASTVGQRTGSGLAPGGDRVLKPNSSYLVIVRNTDSGGSSTADADYFLSWYEGDTDIPL
jgi:hypothetical protein